MGIRKKVAIGFMSLAVLVVGAGAVSFFELGRIGKYTQEVLDAGNLNMTVSRDMMDGAEMMHLSLVHAYSRGIPGPGYDSLYLAGRSLFAESFAAADEGGPATEAVGKAYGQYDDAAYGFFYGPVFPDSRWLADLYGKRYTTLMAAVKNYMTSTEYSLGVRAESIEKNAYRAITPSLVTLGVILLLLFVLFYFVDIYYIQPVVRMNKSLAGWIRYNTPFSPSFEGRDETFQLKENIEELIARAKRAKTYENHE